MSKETFDFSEALRRMKEGKKVCRKNKYGNLIIYFIEKDELGKEWLMQTIIGSNDVYEEPYSVSYLDVDRFILATDWEEVEQ